ncbi:hypothetical protein OHC33_001479 [Knufia fluminis]|uniref:Uncharacterized protein n=1 Tax=Knufia fluminis TaxID=191047 RepID=A0AAN8IBI2_9EURO|nr:hypothetical protein OHC33_001479 [Knufia fluminis]
MADKSDAPQACRNDQPFRFLGLPQELRDKIYKEYFRSTRFAIIEKRPVDLKPVSSWRYHFENNHPNFPAVPSFALESTCKKVCHDARGIREKCWPTKLFVDVGNATPGLLTALFSTERFKYLQNHIQHLTIDHAPALLRSNWENIVTNCPQLRSFCVIRHFEESVTHAELQRLIDSPRRPNEPRNVVHWLDRFFLRELSAMLQEKSAEGYEVHGIVDDHHYTGEHDSLESFRKIFWFTAYKDRVVFRPRLSNW